ncbi:MAG: virulence RhuM family protein [Alkaliphilus sp.]
MPSKSEIIMYQTDDGKTKIEVSMIDNTVWITQAKMCELFQKGKATVSEHISNVFKEGELQENSVVRKFRTTALDGKNYDVKYYNLAVIISVGYRIKSHRGTQFRIWATKLLKEYIIKGFTMNDDLLKNAGGGNYFDELLSRIRDIRSSEKVFWRKVLDIYATSIDYDPKSESSIIFFKTIQNKMHWAAHGHTAAEIIFERVNANKPFMGLTSFKGENPLKADISIAKNYLKEDEIDILNRIVTAYLELAEINAIKRKAMYMNDWLSKLDDFLRMADNEILRHAGRISHDDAIEKARTEYEKYKAKTDQELSKVDQHFIESLNTVEKDIKRIKKK